MKDKDRVEGVTLLDFKIHWKVERISGIWAKIDQWNRTESRNRTTQIQSADLWQRGKGDSMEKGLPFQQMVLEQRDAHMQRNESRHRT